MLVFQKSKYSLSLTKIVSTAYTTPYLVIKENLKPVVAKKLIERCQINLVIFKKRTFSR